MSTKVKGVDADGQPTKVLHSHTSSGHDDRKCRYATAVPAMADEKTHTLLQAILDKLSSIEAKLTDIGDE